MKLLAPLVALGALDTLATAVSDLKVISQRVRRAKPTLNWPTYISRRDARDEDLLSMAALNNLTAGGFFSEVQVGTPAQTIVVHLDTGSSDTWVVASNSDLCLSPSKQAAIGHGCENPFDPGASSTFNLTDEGGLNVNYLDGRGVKGDYFIDHLVVGSQTVENQHLGLGRRVPKGTGLMGLGLSTSTATKDKYPTLLDNLAEQGLIGRATFSVWLNDLDAGEGVVLFGGIDTEKFWGKLTALPVIPIYADAQTATHWVVPLSSIELRNGTAGNENDDSHDQMTPLTSPSLSRGRGILDTGSTLTLLPTDVVDPLFDAFGVVKRESHGLIDCGWADDGRSHGITLDFVFGGSDPDSANVSTTIHVPLHELVLDNLGGMTPETLDLPPRNFTGGVCMFGVQSSSIFSVDEGDDGFFLLGDTFIRSAYVVYDEANMQVGIAQAVLDDEAQGKENLVELEGGVRTLPGNMGRDPAEADERVTERTGGRGGTRGTGGGTRDFEEEGDGSGAVAVRGGGSNGVLGFVVGVAAAVAMF